MDDALLLDWYKDMMAKVEVEDEDDEDEDDEDKDDKKEDIFAQLVKVFENPNLFCKAVAGIQQE